MFIGTTPFGVGYKRKGFDPAKAPWVLAGWDASVGVTLAPSTSLVTAQASLKVNTDVMTASGSARPTLNTTGGSRIGGRAVISYNGTSTVLADSGFAHPAIGSGSLVWYYSVFRANGSASGFNTVAGGSASGGIAPSIFIAGSGTGIEGFAGGLVGPVATGYAQGTPKRYVQYMKGDGAGNDFVQWGAAKVTGNMGSQSAFSGFCLGARYDQSAGTFAAMDLALLLVCTGDPAIGNKLTALDNYYSTLFTGWSGMVS